MAGLNNLISNSAQQQTTLPTWFDTAQQNVVNQANSALNAAPTAQQTVAQNAVNALSGPTNAFTQAGGSLQQIASGAANPWITDASGNVTPNTSTALGGLFQAQNQQLQQLLPNVQGQAQAGAIGSGNFGSLRGQTAVDKAATDAQANLLSSQMTAALNNQQTGVQAGAQAGNVAQQNINNLLTTGQYQQAAPFTNVSNYGKILGGIQAPQTVTNQTQLSPLNQAAGLVSLLGGSSNTSGLLGSLFGTPASGNTAATSGLIGSGGLSSLLSNLFNSNGSGATQNSSGGVTAGTYTLANGGSMTVDANGNQTITNPGQAPQYFNSQGQQTTSDWTVPLDTALSNATPGAADNTNITGSATDSSGGGSGGLAD
jgi:hypothetical protein